MAPVMSLAASARSATIVNSRRPVRGAVAVPRPTVFAVAPAPRSSIIRFSSDTGAENDDKLVGENGEILQGRQDRGGSQPMKESDKSGQQSSKPMSDVASPESGDVKGPERGQGASETAHKESQQQEERPPLRD